MKKYNLIYGTKHVAKYDETQGKFRFDKIASIMENIQSQSSNLKKSHTESEISVQASYIIAEKIDVKSKPFTDGEFMNNAWRRPLKLYVQYKNNYFPN